MESKAADAQKEATASQLEGEKAQAPEEDASKAAPAEAEEVKQEVPATSVAAEVPATSVASEVPAVATTEETAQEPSAQEASQDPDQQVSSQIEPTGISPVSKPSSDASICDERQQEESETRGETDATAPHSQLLEQAPETQPEHEAAPQTVEGCPQEPPFEPVDRAEEAEADSPVLGVEPAPSLPVPENAVIVPEAAVPSGEVTSVADWKQSVETEPLPSHDDVVLLREPVIDVGSKPLSYEPDITVEESVVPVIEKVLEDIMATADAPLERSEPICVEPVSQETPEVLQGARVSDASQQDEKVVLEEAPAQVAAGPTELDSVEAAPVAEEAPADKLALQGSESEDYPAQETAEESVFADAEPSYDAAISQSVEPGSAAETGVEQPAVEEEKAIDGQLGTEVTQEVQPSSTAPAGSASEPEHTEEEPEATPTAGEAPAEGVADSQHSSVLDDAEEDQREGDSGGHLDVESRAQQEVEVAEPAAPQAVSEEPEGVQAADVPAGLAEPLSKDFVFVEKPECEAEAGEEAAEEGGHEVVAEKRAEAEAEAEVEVEPPTVEGGDVHSAEEDWPRILAEPPEVEEAATEDVVTETEAAWPVPDSAAEPAEMQWSKPEEAAEPVKEGLSQGTRTEAAFAWSSGDLEPESTQSESVVGDGDATVASGDTSGRHVDPVGLEQDGAALVSGDATESAAPAGVTLVSDPEDAEDGIAEQTCTPDAEVKKEEPTEIITSVNEEEAKLQEEIVKQKEVVEEAKGKEKKEEKVEE